MLSLIINIISLPKNFINSITHTTTTTTIIIIIKFFVNEGPFYSITGYFAFQVVVVALCFEGLIATITNFNY